MLQPNLYRKRVKESASERALGDHDENDGDDYLDASTAEGGVFPGDIVEPVHEKDEGGDGEPVCEGEGAGGEEDEDDFTCDSGGGLF